MRILKLMILAVAACVAINAGEEKVVYAVNSTSAKLSMMLHEGKIVEDRELKAALGRRAGNWLIAKMEGFGFSYKVREHMDSWVFIRDREYVVILGTVKEQEMKGFFFVWVLRLNSEHLESAYLSVAGKVLEGDRYPFGVTPFSSVWDKIRWIASGIIPGPR